MHRDTGPSAALAVAFRPSGNKFEIGDIRSQLRREGVKRFFDCGELQSARERACGSEASSDRGIAPVKNVAVVDGVSFVDRQS